MNRVRKTVPIIFGILILTSLSGFQFAPMNVQTAEAEPSKKIVGYFPYWESGDMSSIDYSKLTDIIYFHIWPNADGTLDTSVVDINQLHIIRDNSHAVGVKMLIAVGGWGVSDDFPAMASNPTARANFVSNVLDYLIVNDLDGVDIDWETPLSQEKTDDQDVLLSDLSDALHPMAKLVTVAANGDVLELKPSAANSVDWVNVMAYDMNWGNAEHSTFDDSVSALLRYETGGIPKEKLALGIPFYGRDDSTNALKYEDIESSCNPLPEDNYCNGYFFNGINLVQQKSQFVLDNGYYGVMIWNLGQDTYDQTSLLGAINQVLEGTPLPDMPPVSSNDNYSTEAGNTLNIGTPGVLSNDDDPNNDPITAVLNSDVTNGILSLKADGSFSYSPNSDFDGVDSFSYHANDGINDSNIVTVTITVNPTNNIHLENLEILKSGNKRWTGTVTITIFGENDKAVSDVTAYGTWFGGANGAVSCVTDSVGQCSLSKSTKGDILTFTLDEITGINLTYDSTANNAENSITINRDETLPDQNTIPTSDAGGPYSGIINETIAFDGSVSSDPDGDSLTYSWDFGDGNTSNDENPTHIYTLDGIFNVALEVTDSQGASDIHSTIVTISSQGGTNLTVTQVSPNSMIKGQTISATILGTGFDQNASVEFSGEKWTPKAISIAVIDSQTIEIDVTRTSAGPNRVFVYDVTVINPNGDSFTTPQSFTVTS